MPGTNAPNLKEGSRSEILADYLFSAWGSVTPVRLQDDYGVDLFCTLTDRIGKRGVVRDYYTVQVKSGTAPWKFANVHSVKWLVEYPTPLFLACVEKKKGAVSVYHLMPRFAVAAQCKQPKRLRLKPEMSAEGEAVQWLDGESFSLSAPIIRATIVDLLDKRRMAKLRQAFAYWVRQDRENCDLVRQGLLKYRMPASYKTNELPNSGITELAYRSLEREFLHRGIRTLADAAAFIGGQFRQLEDNRGALRAALLARYLLIQYKDVFEGQLWWRGNLPGPIRFLVEELNRIGRDLPGNNYIFKGIDEAERALEEIPIVKSFLNGKKLAGNS